MKNIFQVIFLLGLTFMVQSHTTRLDKGPKLRLLSSAAAEEIKGLKTFLPALDAYQGLTDHIKITSSETSMYSEEVRDISNSIYNQHEFIIVEDPMYFINKENLSDEELMTLVDTQLSSNLSSNDYSAIKGMIVFVRFANNSDNLQEFKILMKWHGTFDELNDARKAHFISKYTEMINNLSAERTYNIPSASEETLDKMSEEMNDGGMGLETLEFGYDSFEESQEDWSGNSSDENLYFLAPSGIPIVLPSNATNIIFSRGGHIRMVEGDQSEVYNSINYTGTVRRFSVGDTTYAAKYYSNQTPIFFAGYKDRKSGKLKTFSVPSSSNRNNLNIKVGEYEQDALGNCICKTYKITGYDVPSVVTNPIPNHAKGIANRTTDFISGNKTLLSEKPANQYRCLTNSFAEQFANKYLKGATGAIKDKIYEAAFLLQKMKVNQDLYYDYFEISFKNFVDQNFLDFWNSETTPLTAERLDQFIAGLETFITEQNQIKQSIRKIVNGNENEEAELFNHLLRLSWGMYASFSVPEKIQLLKLLADDNIEMADFFEFTTYSNHPLIKLLSYNSVSAGDYTDRKKEHYDSLLQALPLDGLITDLYAKFDAFFSSQERDQHLLVTHLAEMALFANNLHKLQKPDLQLNKELYDEKNITKHFIIRFPEKLTDKVKLKEDILTTSFTHPTYTGSNSSGAPLVTFDQTICTKYDTIAGFHEIGYFSNRVYRADIACATDTTYEYSLPLFEMVTITFLEDFDLFSVGQDQGNGDQIIVPAIVLAHIIEKHHELQEYNLFKNTVFESLRLAGWTFGAGQLIVAIKAGSALRIAKAVAQLGMDAVGEYAISDNFRVWLIDSLKYSPANATTIQNRLSVVAFMGAILTGGIPDDIAIQGGKYVAAQKQLSTVEAATDGIIQNKKIIDKYGKILETTLPKDKLDEGATLFAKEMAAGANISGWELLKNDVSTYFKQIDQADRLDLENILVTQLSREGNELLPFLQQARIDQNLTSKLDAWKDIYNAAGASSPYLKNTNLIDELINFRNTQANLFDGLNDEAIINLNKTLIRIFNPEEAIMFASKVENFFITKFDLASDPPNIRKKWLKKLDEIDNPDHLKAFVDDINEAPNSQDLVAFFKGDLDEFGGKVSRWKILSEESARVARTNIDNLAIIDEYLYEYPTRIDDVRIGFNQATNKQQYLDNLLGPGQSGEIVNHRVRGLYDNINVSDNLNGTLIDDFSEINARYTMVISESPGGVNGEFVRKYIPSQNMFVFDAGFRKDAPSWLDNGQVPLIYTKGISTQMLVTLRQMKSLDIPIGSLQKSKLSTIQNIETMMWLSKEMKDKGWTSLSQVQAHILNAPQSSVGYATSTLKQAGYRTEDAYITTNTSGSLQTKVITFSDLKFDPRPHLNKITGEDLARYGLSWDDEAFINFNIILKLTSF